MYGVTVPLFGPKAARWLLAAAQIVARYSNVVRKTRHRVLAVAETVTRWSRV